MTSKAKDLLKLQYLNGFQNFHKSETLRGSLPLYQNHPQNVAYNLYGEVFSGSAFTVPRHLNRYTLMYRLRPSVFHNMKNCTKIQTVDEHVGLMSATNLNDGYKNYMESFYQDFKEREVTLWTPPPVTGDSPLPPVQLRWNHMTPPPNGVSIDFFQSLTTMAYNGNSQSTGGSILMYNCNTSMDPSFSVDTYNMNQSSEYPRHPTEGGSGRYLNNHDAEMLIIPHRGALLVRTELGDLTVEPLEIAVIPRGLKFQICLLPKNFSALSTDDTTEDVNDELINKEDAHTFTHAGYVCENFGQQFQLPELGPIGITTGLAHQRHFASPVAAFENSKGTFETVTKYRGHLWKCSTQYSPFDVVSWFGNNLPYKYDLRLFTCINSVTHDHPDPSIYTVLTSPSECPGTANIDFVIFPPRWMVQENTFRPPWFHRNYMSEAMGLLKGVYDAKSDGFVPGGLSIHNQYIPHGPDYSTWMNASSADTMKPRRVSGTMAFMLESNKSWSPTPLVYNGEQSDGSQWRQSNYSDCWSDLNTKFDTSNIIEQHIPFKQ